MKFSNEELRLMALALRVHIERIEAYKFDMATGADDRAKMDEDQGKARALRKRITVHLA